MRSPEAPPDAAPEVEAATEGHPTVSPWRLVALIAGFVALGVWKGWSLLLVVGAILLMIFLHELGHFVMARRAGMKVTEFFLFFGPRIWSFRRGEVEYGIKAIPAGAYVRVIGMTNVDEVAPEDEHRTYRQKAFWPRIGVAVAGSAMHFILALLLFFGVFFFAGRPSEAGWTADEISQGSAAASAGLQVGDRVVAVDGTPVETFDEMAHEVRERPDRDVVLAVERDGEVVDLETRLGGRASIIGTVGEDLAFGAHDGTIRIHSIAPGSRAAAAGLRDDMIVLSVNGQPLASLEQVPTIVDTIEGGIVRLGVEGPDGTRSEHEVNLGHAVDVTDPQGFLGVGPRTGREDLGVLGAAGASVSSFGQLTGTAIKSIGIIFNPVNIVRFADQVISGAPDSDSKVDVPTTARETGEAYIAQNSTRPSSILGIIDIGTDFTDDWPAFVQFLGAVNVMIGVLNLIPLLPFDGGHVAVACYERIRELRRRDGRRYLVDARRLMPAVYAVVIVLATVALLAVVADITQPLQI